MPASSHPKPLPPACAEGVVGDDLAMTPGGTTTMLCASRASGERGSVTRSGWDGWLDDVVVPARCVSGAGCAPATEAGTSDSPAAVTMMVTWRRMTAPPCRGRPPLAALR